MILRSTVHSTISQLDQFYKLDTITTDSMMINLTLPSLVRLIHLELIEIPTKAKLKLCNT